MSRTQLNQLKTAKQTEDRQTKQGQTNRETYKRYMDDNKQTTSYEHKHDSHRKFYNARYLTIN